MSSSKRPDPPGDSPPRSSHKRAKSSSTGRSPESRRQTSLVSFFGTHAKKSDVKSPCGEYGRSTLAAIDSKSEPVTTTMNVAPVTESNNLSESKMIEANQKNLSQSIPISTCERPIVDAIIPRNVPPDRTARWMVKHESLLIRTVPSDSPREKVAAFDLDGTLLVWRISGWPNQFDHYELWNSVVVAKLQDLYDLQGYKLVIFSNQGAIRSAFGGKKASFVKSLIEWLANELRRPLHVVMSTNSKKGFHKPNPGMWGICEQDCNNGQHIDVAHSFYVGDSVGLDDPQGGVDQLFAQQIGDAQKPPQSLAFYEPQTYFGPSHAAQRQKNACVPDSYDAPPQKSIEEHAALLGGYLRGPILLIMVGVQGSGKSTFCINLTKGIQDCQSWIHLSQDTIRDGKPGTRDLVENATRQALRGGKSVVVDRMHLTKEQRFYFIQIAREANVHVHAVVLQPPKDLVEKRIRERTHHPAGVQGDQGVKIAIKSLMNLVFPSYNEGFDLVRSTGTEAGASRLCQLYSLVSQSQPTIPGIPSSFTLSNGEVIPSITLGTMGIGKCNAQKVVEVAARNGWKAVDTAPSYKNEAEVGNALISTGICVTVKIPKIVTTPDQALVALNTSLSRLGKNRADLLLLHWPCDVIESGTMLSVWQEMERLLSQGRCRAIGVCNFSIQALCQLIPLCRVHPLVNQIERHPLLPQMDLVTFCMNHDILVQAHTPLGQGKPELLSHVTLLQIARETGLSTAQVVLMWNLQHGVAVVPRCTAEDHLSRLNDLLEGKPLRSKHMQMVDNIPERLRFVAPPFMYKKGTTYSWMTEKLGVSPDC